MTGEHRAANTVMSRPSGSMLWMWGWQYVIVLFPGLRAPARSGPRVSRSCGGKEASSEAIVEDRRLLPGSVGSLESCFRLQIYNRKFMFAPYLAQKMGGRYEFVGVEETDVTEQTIFGV